MMTANIMTMNGINVEKQLTEYFVHWLSFSEQNALCSMIILSLWFYLHDVIKTDHVTFYYDLVIYYVASVISGLTISLHADRTRNIKKIVLILVGFEIFGSCVYSIYTSVNFVIVARFILGFGSVILALVTAEMARDFPVKNALRKLPTLSLVFLELSCCHQD